MLIREKVTIDFEIEKLEDLEKLKELEGVSDLKVNKSELGRKLGVDRRTIAKYIKGYKKPSDRRRKSQFDEYYELISKLLANEEAVFAYKRILWQYLRDNHGMSGAQSSFRRYISQKPEFNKYFQKDNRIKSDSPMRFETGAGEQVQVDWKEKITFKLDTGETIIFHIFVFLLSFSRFRIYRLSLSMTREVTQHLLNDCFEVIGGVVQKAVFDNTKAVMDEPRTKYRKGKINPKFQEFAKDYGFEIHPCISKRPQTKAKVEAPMKILDELLAYSGKLSFEGLLKKLAEINDRENTRYHEAYQMHPIMGLKKEKDSLRPLPPETLRSLYHIKTIRAKVNKSSMFSYKGSHYSVAPDYIGKHVQIQLHDQHLNVYYNKILITIHQISEKKLNYLEEHYVEIAKRTLPFPDEKIEEIAKENLRKIGERYEYNNT